MIYHISPKPHLFQIPFSQLTSTSATFNQLENATLILEHFRTKRKLNRNLATVRRGTPHNNKKTRKPPKWWMEPGLHTEDHDGDDRATKKTFNYPRSPPEDWAFAAAVPLANGQINIVPQVQQQQRQHQQGECLEFTSGAHRNLSSDIAGGCNYYATDFRSCCNCNRWWCNTLSFFVTVFLKSKFERINLQTASPTIFWKTE